MSLCCKHVVYWKDQGILPEGQLSVHKEAVKTQQTVFALQKNVVVLVRPA